MNAPKYLVKWPDELVWIAWATALAGLVAVVLTSVGVSTEITVAVSGFILATARLISGALLPTPTMREEIASVRESMDDPGNDPPKTP